MIPLRLRLLARVCQAEDGIRDWSVTGVQTCALPISWLASTASWVSNSDRSMVAPSPLTRSEERRVGKSVDLGGRRIIRKKGREGKRSVELGDCGRGSMRVESGERSVH